MLVRKMTHYCQTSKCDYSKSGLGEYVMTPVICPNCHNERGTWHTTVAQVEVIEAATPPVQRLSTGAAATLRHVILSRLDVIYEMYRNDPETRLITLRAIFDLCGELGIPRDFIMHSIPISLREGL